MLLWLVYALYVLSGMIGLAINRYLERLNYSICNFVGHLVVSCIYGPFPSIFMALMWGGFWLKDHTKLCAPLFLWSKR